MKHVVSVSLGSSKRDMAREVELLGQPMRIERRGVDGDLDRFRATFAELDGHVDALGIGGADLRVHLPGRSYVFKQIQELVSVATQTPVVDGGGLKHTLERSAVTWIEAEGPIDLTEQDALVVSGVDRHGLAQELSTRCRSVVFADLMVGLGIPVPIRSYASVERLGKALLPLVTKLPFKWVYPTGEKQETRTPKFGSTFGAATLIAGDWHYVRRYAPDRMEGKTILTQTLRAADLDWLRSTGAARAITTTPVVDGETFATNVMEAALVALVGKAPSDMTDQDYLSNIDALGWRPSVIPLQENV